MPSLPCSVCRHSTPLVGLLTLLIGFPAFAADVIAITDGNHPMVAPTGVRVIRLDEPARIEANFNQHLPADPARSTTLVQQRLNFGGTALQRRIASAYQGVMDAWRLGVSTIPAVVVDRRYVVYGVTDVVEAIARIEEYRGAQP